jgi:hypothetical protein
MVGIISITSKIWPITLLERLTDAGSEQPYDFDVMEKAPVIFPVELDEAPLHKGTGVQNYIFNRLDYLLWLNLKNKRQFAGVDMQYIENRVKNFTFTFRTSVEHYSPQHPMNNELPLEETQGLKNGVDNFGNLCLISPGNNSKLSNYSPVAKKEHYEKSTHAESLKQVFMMSYGNWDHSSVANILHHKNMMINVLLYRY